MNESWNWDFILKKNNWVSGDLSALVVVVVNGRYLFSSVRFCVLTISVSWLCFGNGEND